MVDQRYENILYEKNETIARITLNRPDKLNAINMEMALELKDALLNFETDDDARVGLITGSGNKAFSVGGDMDMFPALLADVVATYKFGRLGYDIHRLMERIEKPMIAAVKGYCLSGGLEIALACDFIIASDDASFGLAEITIGFIPQWGGTIRLSRAIPARRAKEMILMGEPMTAQEAERLGLVNRIVPEPRLFDVVNEIASKLAHRPSLAIKVAKNIVNYGLETPSIDAALFMERGAACMFTAAQEPKERVRAFLERGNAKTK